MAKLPDAIEALTSVAELQLQVAREQLSHDRRREIREHTSSPEFLAEMEAQRNPLRPISAQAFVRAAPFVYAGAFDAAVPPEFYVQVDDGSYLVACPCATEHRVGRRGYPSAAECGRYFMYDGEELRVAFSPRLES